MRCLVDAWRWQAADRALHALPLHHIHGIVNALHCAHAAGAAVDFMSSFHPAAAWRRLKVRRGAPRSCLCVCFGGQRVGGGPARGRAGWAAGRLLCVCGSRGAGAAAAARRLAATAHPHAPRRPYLPR